MGVIALWNTQKGELSCTQKHTGVDEWDNTNAVNSQGNLLAFYRYRFLEIWSIQPWKKEFEIGDNDLGRYRPSSLKWSKDGRWIAVSTWGGRVFVFELESRSMVKILDAGHEKINAVSFSYDGSMLAAVGSDQIIRVWKTNDWKTIIQLPDLDGALNSCLAFHPKKNLLAVGTRDGSLVKIFELRAVA